MTNYNPENERIKKAYFIYLKEADQKAEATINAIRKAILRLEEYTDFSSFKSFNKDQAIGFKRHLSGTTAKVGNKPLAKATVLSTINALKSYLGWLRFQVGFKSSINPLDIEYLNLSEKETRAAKAPKHKIFPTLEQIRTVISLMPHETAVEKRDRAVMAFTILSGMRDKAITSLKLKHIDLHRNYVNQDPNDVQTKFSKRIDTFFFPVGEDIKSIFSDWVSYLKEEELYNLDAPLFPQTKLGHDENKSFTPIGLEPIHWATASPIRIIFKNAFERAGIPYFNPHLFRDTLIHLGQQMCTTPEEFKAWSQNIGHESPLTTFTSYGQIDPYRQGDIIKGLSEKKQNTNINEEILAILKAKTP
jgi:integrase/recombinase XerD